MLSRFTLCLLFLLSSLAACAQTLPTVTIQTNHPRQSFRPDLALGAGVDGLEEGDVAKVYTPPTLRAMRSAGLGALTYRLRTELGIAAWHWNTEGAWSDLSHKQGYWTSRADTPKPVTVGYGYKLPRRGSTSDQANHDGYSRLDDGNPNTYWKSNPYLDTHYTAEPNSQHPQWVLINLGKPQTINALQIAWGIPYATQYHAEYWDGGQNGDPDSIDETFYEGQWREFPGTHTDAGRGGQTILRLLPTPKPLRYIRLMLTESSETAPPGSTDTRDGLGYAIREIGLGTLDANGVFHDLIRHARDAAHQTQITVSSCDPWHTSKDKDPKIEQPGFDLVFRQSSLTHNLPVLMPVGLLYDTPENAAAEVRFWKQRGYPVQEVEMGEEPDGQYMLPEDYAALYCRWANILHKENAALKLGGPCFQTDIVSWRAWPNAQGGTSWIRRFLGYLKAHGHSKDFNFMSFEWYPFDEVCVPAAPQLAQEPFLLARAIRQLHEEGLPSSLPIYITEYGYSAFAGQPEVDVPGALLNADIVGQFLTLGGARAYLYGYEPNALMKENCDSYGNLTLFLADDNRHIRAYTPAYWGAWLLTHQWAKPGQGTHQIFSVTCSLPSVTAYAVHRPDGQWAILLVNKDPRHSHSVRVRFQSSHTVTNWRGPHELWQYGQAQYVWHPKGEHGYALPNLPPLHKTVNGNSVTLPPYSLTVLRGAAP